MSSAASAHQSARAENDIISRRNRQTIRLEALRGLIREVGLGETDPARTKVDDMIVERLREAYELLSMRVG